MRQNKKVEIYIYKINTRSKEEIELCNKKLAVNMYVNKCNGFQRLLY